MLLVLVVDDDPTQRLAASAVLEKAGYEVAEAGDGTEGLEAARLLKPDLILCDVMMPGLNGFQVLEAVRADRVLSDTPVIMLTSMAERSHMRKGMTAGADDYLPKPFSPAELKDAVSTLLARRKLQRGRMIDEIKQKFLATLEGEKQTLAYEYEMKLAEALSSRWSTKAQQEEDVAYPDCTLVVVNLFESVLARTAADADAAAAVKRAYQNAKDTLYLFGARHIVAQGDDLLAVFVGDAEADPASVRLRALRAAMGLAKSAPAAPGTPGALAVAVHRGGALLLQVEDPLHGETASTLLTGEAVRSVGALLEFAKASGWRVVGSAAVLDEAAAQLKPGRRGRASGSTGPIEAVELLALA